VLVEGEPSEPDVRLESAAAVPAEPEPTEWQEAVAEAEPGADAPTTGETPDGSWTVVQLDAWAEGHSDAAPDYPWSANKPEKVAYLASVTDGKE
jgi:hypothetical protein